MRNFVPLCFGLTFLFLVLHGNTIAQMPPPGYDRAVQIERERSNMSRMDRDSIMIIDTVSIYDPETYESTVSVIQSTYSLRDYCKSFLKMNNPDILLDEQPHTIVDPNTYEDVIVRLTPQGKIEKKPKE